MKYQKEVIDKYAIGKYVEIEFCTEIGRICNLTGWLVPNNEEIFRSMSRYKYLLLMSDNMYYQLNVKDFEKITLMSNGYTLPKTMKRFQEHARKKAQECPVNKLKKGVENQFYEFVFADNSGDKEWGQDE